jgi:hypothetical protein
LILGPCLSRSRGRKTSCWTSLEDPKGILHQIRYDPTPLLRCLYLYFLLINYSIVLRFIHYCLISCL